MDHLSSPKLPLNEQDNCDLFEKLPGEVRDRIYTFALSCFDDPDELVSAKVSLLLPDPDCGQYERNTPYWRPNCLAHPKVECALLQTCQRIYNEAWFRPWASTTQKLWLTHPRRRPDDTKILTTSKLQFQLARVFGSRGRVETNGVQVFPQLYMLEHGSALSDILRLDHLYPYTVTITIRHHDWWYWEYDNRLRIGAKWVNECRFPDSVRIIKLELESLQRKSNQIDFIAEMMQNTWYFQRNDGTIFSAAKDDVTTSIWTGSSTWENQRWIRDETRPDQVDYYIKTVSWKPDREITTIEKPAPDLLAPDRFPVIEDASAYLYTWQLSSAGVPPGTGASEAKWMVLRFIQNGINTGHFDD
jgi:hypothetical protein